MDRAEIVPQKVFTDLTEDQVEEFEQALASYEGMTLRNSIPLMESSNPALKYIVLMNPLKYTLLQHPSLSEESLLSLIAFDRSRLDEFHKTISFPDGNAQWEQDMTTVEAALGNPNLSTESAKMLIQAVLSSNPENYSETELMNVIAHQLLDKWDPAKFRAPALRAIVELMMELGAVENLPKYKRLLRHAKS